MRIIDNGKDVAGNRRNILRIHISAYRATNRLELGKGKGHGGQRTELVHNQTSGPGKQF